MMSSFLKHGVLQAVPHKGNTSKKQIKAKVEAVVVWEAGHRMSMKEQAFDIGLSVMKFDLWVRFLDAGTLQLNNIMK